MPALPEPSEVSAFLAEMSLSPAQAEIIREASCYYWSGPQLTDKLDPNAWKRACAKDLIVAAGQAILANLLDPTVHIRFPWLRLHSWLGPLPPGEVWVVCARTGSGKTVYILNWINAIYATERAFTLLPLEQGVDEIIRKLAALRTMTPYAKLIRGDPSITTEDLETLNTETMTLAERFVRLGVLLVGDRRLSTSILTTALKHAADLGHSLVIVDHIHRLEVTGASEEAKELARLMRVAKDMAYRLSLNVVFTAQLNRADQTRLAPFHPPKLTDLRGSAIIEQESDVILGLWRPMRPLTPKQTRALECGDREPREFIIPNRMAITCLKHRRDEGAFMRQVRLHVEHGVIRDLTDEEEKQSDFPGPLRRRQVEKPRDLFEGGERGDAWEPPPVQDDRSGNWWER